MINTMDIKRQKFEKSSSLSKQNIAKTTSVILGINNTDVEIEATRIRTLCDKFAEIAFSMGETNDIEEYAEEMSATIFEAYKKVEKRKKKKRN